MIAFKSSPSYRHNYVGIDQALVLWLELLNGCSSTPHMVSHTVWPLPSVPSHAGAWACESGGVDCKRRNKDMKGTLVNLKLKWECYHVLSLFWKHHFFQFAYWDPWFWRSPSLWNIRTHGIWMSQSSTERRYCVFHCHSNQQNFDI